MQRYNGYLIVSDLDGTLIDSKQKISKKNQRAISTYIENSGYFAVATGRSEINVKPFIENININCSCILYNGAMIYDFDKMKYVRCAFLKNSYLLEPLKEMMSLYRNLCVQIFTQGKMFIVSGEDNIDPLVISENQPYTAASIDDLAEENWIKVIFNDTNQALRSIQQFLTDRIAPGIIKSVFSTSTYLELLAYGVSKGSALLELMHIMKLRREKVIAIGDYCNDIEMIRVAGLGVATANAHDLLKKAASVTTVSNDEHAVYNLINKIIPDYELSIRARKLHSFSTGSRDIKSSL